ncbi:energy-coupling factor ABC transporter permease [Salsipaludibacter albus]|uniref:energy-coupling factor ABC transporter permease n=1 Tax=Salsipaludibacter albus TaxID=2849650 RepID=UPI001EE3C5E9|nr:energy-coupling factor ABC transporter permease [Salsipaludibacter albus]MBY5161935.1 energy-coupling factor ABC transporter permease [Salsipaludibacter albus]
MHAPDGFLTAGTAVATGVVSVTGIGVALRRTRDALADRAIPLAGLTGAFVFAGQMFNFPIAAGTTGHLLGGALAAVLLGPWLGALVVSVVVVVQALLFADGGLTALGYNVLNMALVTAFGGWAVFRLARRFLPATRVGISTAAGIAGFASVVLSAMAFSLEWLFGASAPVPFDRVFTAMVGVHGLIGIGEGVITGLVVAAVLASRPDLVTGADGMEVQDSSRASIGRFVVGAAVVTLLVAGGVSQFAGSDPDGLETVAQEQGFATQAQDHALGSSLFADYATAGVADERVSLALAGFTGVAVTLAVASGVALAGRRRFS